MEAQTLPFFVFKTHSDAEKAIRAIHKSGFDVKKLSLVGKGYHSEEHPMGFYTIGDRIKSWGQSGAFWGSIWGMLLAPAVFLVPGLGLTIMAGPIATLLIGALEGAAVVGGVSALGGALSQIGVPKNQVIKYETALKADNFVLMVHGSAADADTVRAVLARTDAPEVA
jgi:hypothetical protein